MHEKQLTHAEIAKYNWDDGFDAIWPIIDDPQTNHATALLVYWRIEGPWLTDEVMNSNRELRKMKETLEQRLLTGFYAKGKIRYDPVVDNQLSRVQVFKLKKAGLPVQLIEPE